MKRIIWLLLLAAVSVEADSPNTASELYPLMSQWLDLESQKGRLESDWALRQLELERRLQLYEAEEKALRELLSQVESSSEEADERRASLSEEQTALEKQQSLLESQIQRVSHRMQSMQPRLPPPVRQQWREKNALLGDDSAGNSKKLERILALFKLAEEFNDRVALNEVAMEVPAADGGTETVMVTQIYLGLSQGWYVSENGRRYGYGRARDGQWQWFHNSQAERELGAPLAVDKLLQLRSILQEPAKAEFIALPVQL